MPLFQESIVKKYLSTIDESVIESAYLEYKRVYSPEKIKNIQVAKEEQYQEGFIKDVFGSVLGYSVYPEHPYNIETEKKNETNAKKADGAILKDEKVVGVIELKDNKTKNLEAVKDQAFGYKHNHKECNYVISSNFHKLRFYIDDATDYEEFDLYNLDKETFKRFYLYLRKEGLLDKNLPKLLREETKFHEEEISKKLYKDYSNFKRSFYENAVKNNPEHDKLILFKKSQKFLDRILFLLFAEDKGLVGTNSIVNIVEKWSGADDDYYQPLYEMVNKYFGHLYRGYTYQKTGEVIPQFGGELFAPDDVLETLKIDDDVLKNDLLILSKYDFNTDVDVNILGHIFEHSLNEVDDVEAELRGEQLDKTKSKRKKDGVFYTPKYITKYIVDNTLGKLCSEKKAELKLDQDIAIFDYQKTDGKLNEKGKDLFERLNTYKSWLLTVKVCDPACGSGAFLNQALSFFIEEHKFVDDLIAELTNSPLRLFDTDLQILENNIYGVDINEESVEIAKLSLWLRTAQPGRKLSNLSNNIKCGNSLIDDPEVAGDKAFNWENGFPTVFEKGGFDVVIGNPPYVQVFDLIVKSALENKYDCFRRNNDLYSSFYQLSIGILKTNGIIGFITPNSFIKGDYFKNLRDFFIQFQIHSIVDFNNELVFQDANVFSAILILEKKLASEDWILKSNLHEVKGIIKNGANEFIPVNPILTKFSSIPVFENYFLIKDVGFNYWSVGGEKTRGNSIGDRILYKGEREDDKDIPYTKGSNFHRYSEIENENFLRHNYTDFLNSNDTFRFSEELLKRSPKLIYRQTSSTLIGTIDHDSNYCDKTVHIIVTKENINIDYRYLLAIFNSKLLNYFYKIMTEESGRAFAQVKTVNVKKLPFIISENNFTFKEQVDKIMSLTKIFKAHINKLSSYIRSQNHLEKLTSKLSNWHEVDFTEFIKELNKAIKASKGTSLTKKDEFEWMELFEENKKKVLELKSEIDKTDKEIDVMVYELYGLSEEEIQIVENS
jgi:hypothetical protein